MFFRIICDYVIGRAFSSCIFFSLFKIFSGIFSWILAFVFCGSLNKAYAISFSTYLSSQSCSSLSSVILAYSANISRAKSKIFSRDLSTSATKPYLFSLDSNIFNLGLTAFPEAISRPKFITSSMIYISSKVVADFPRIIFLQYQLHFLVFATSSIEGGSVKYKTILSSLDSKYSKTLS